MQGVASIRRAGHSLLHAEQSAFDRGRFEKPRLGLMMSRSPAPMFHTGTSRRREENSNTRPEQHGTNERSAARPGPQQQRLSPNILDDLPRPIAIQPAAARDVPRSVRSQADCHGLRLNPPPYVGGYSLT